MERVEVVDEPVEAKLSAEVEMAASSQSSKLSLLEQLHQRGTALIEEAEREGEVSKEEVEKLHDLWRLTEIHGQIRLAHRRKWVLFIAALVLLSIWLFPLFWRIPSLAISLDARISEVGFKLTQRQMLTDALSPTQLHFSGLKEIHLPRGRGRSATTISLPGSGVVTLIALGAEGEEIPPGHLTLGSLTLPAESYCRVGSTDDDPGRVRFDLRDAEIDLQVNVDGRIRIRIPGNADLDLWIPSPDSVVLVPYGDRIIFDMLFTEMPARLLQPRLAVDDLDLTRSDEARWYFRPAWWPARP